MLASAAALAASWVGADAHDRYRAAVDRAAAAATGATAAQQQLLGYGSADLQQQLAAELARARRQTISGPTAELGELELQDLLSAAATRAGLRNLRVSAVRGETDPAPIRAIAATIEGDYDRTALVGLLENLSQSDTAVRVSEIDVRNDGSSQRIALTAEATYVARGALR